MLPQSPHLKGILLGITARQFMVSLRHEACINIIPTDYNRIKSMLRWAIRNLEKDVQDTHLASEG